MYHRHSSRFTLGCCWCFCGCKFWKVTSSLGGWCASGPLGDWADWLFSRTWKHSIGFNTIHEAISLVFCFVLRKCTETHRVVAGPLLHACEPCGSMNGGDRVCIVRPRPPVAAFAHGWMSINCLCKCSHASSVSARHLWSIHRKSFIDNQCQHAMFALVRLIWLWLPAPLTLSTLIGRILLRPCNFVNTHTISHELVASVFFETWKHVEFV